MWAKRHTPQRGLLAGLVALIVFASGAVAITANGSSTATAGATQTQSARTVEAVISNARDVNDHGGHHR